MKGLRLTAILLVLGLAGQAEAGTCGNGVLEGTFTQVSAGGFHTCAINTSDDTVECWGRDDYGQSSPPSGTFTEVAAGGDHTCAINSSGAVECWGAGTTDSSCSYDGGYECGQSSPPAGTFTQVSAGYRHTCAINSSGTVECWGYGTTSSACNEALYYADGYGEPWWGCGQANPPAGTFTQVSAGWIHTCGLKSTGAVECWGADWDGRSSPPAGTFVHISTGGDLTCGRTSSGELECWGAGDGTETGYPHFGQSISPTGTFTQVASGGYHTCGIKSDGTVECWGLGTESSSCASELTSYDYEVTVCGQSSPPAGTFTQVSAGEYHTCGLKSSGAVECWGAGDGTETGYPHFGQSSPPSEQCDDGNTSNIDSCLSSCIAATCGDGHVYAGIEDCDGSGSGIGGETASCDSDCTASICGDGTVNTTAGEQCDDGYRSRTGEMLADEGFHGRIVNGVLTHDYPTTGALLYHASGNAGSAYIACSGTLIGCETFLTAAHCIDNDPYASHYFVYLQHGGVYTVESMVLHSNYLFPVADVAVLKLAEPVTGIVPTAVNVTDPTPFIPQLATIVGYGLTAGDLTDPGIKRMGAVQTTNCGYPVSATDTELICWDYTWPIGPPGEDSNTCMGDSGGPLFMDLGLGEVVAGVTSGGLNAACGAPDNSYDANVYTYSDFILSNLGDDSTSSCGDISEVGGGGVTVQEENGFLPSGDSQPRTITIPANVDLLRITMNGEDNGSFDSNLYVKYGASASNTDYDCKSDGPGVFGGCEIASPAAGTWHFTISSYSGSGNYQTTAAVFGGGCDSSCQLETTRTCGDADDNGSILASDALITLKAAVGLGSCDLCVCDVDDSGGILAADALLVLKKAVGLVEALDCPSCSTMTTTTTLAPTTTTTTLAPTTTTTTMAAPVPYGGYYWYLGESYADSCDDVCEGRGGCNPAGIAYAGSQGSSSVCSAVLDALGVPADNYGDGTDEMHINQCWESPCEKVGCSVDSYGWGGGYDEIDRYILYPAICWASGESQRACACGGGGLSYGGYLWYLGNTNQSCNEVCEDRGGCDAAGITYAGSQGSSSVCTAVLTALGMPPDSYGDGTDELTTWSGSSIELTGCSAETYYSEFVDWYVFYPGNCAAVYTGTHRACACNQ